MSALVARNQKGPEPSGPFFYVRAFDRGQRLEGFYVREVQKAHGTRELIANKPAAGTKVVIVDDVITTGKSVIDAVDAARDADCVVVGVIVLMDRQEGGEAAIRATVPTYHAIYTRQDFPEIGEAEKWDTTTSGQRSTISA